MQFFKELPRKFMRSSWKRNIFRAKQNAFLQRCEIESTFLGFCRGVNATHASLVNCCGCWKLKIVLRMFAKLTGSDESAHFFSSGLHSKMRKYMLSSFVKENCVTSFILLQLSAVSLHKILHLTYYLNRKRRSWTMIFFYDKEQFSLHNLSVYQ